MAEQLKDHDINVPKIISHHPTIGVTIQNDLGDDDLISLMNDKNREFLINKSIDLLVDIHKVDIEGLVHLSSSDLKDQMNKFKYCLLYTSPSPRDPVSSRMPSSA